MENIKSQERTGKEDGTKTYTANLSKDKNRTGWSIIFRHPVRFDASGKLGLRVRRGLATRDEAEAEKLKNQLNELLADQTYHNLAAKAEASRRFDSRVVDIFFDGIIPTKIDFRALRGVSIPLPSSEKEGYHQVMCLGTTGAGKTTLIRQIIGTDPVTERFPSTSTAKTTINDTEIILSEGPWRAVVTFVPQDEVCEYLNECISAAVLAASRNTSDSEILRYLLNHVNQRFRFNYVLGNGPRIKETSQNDFSDDSDDNMDDSLDVELIDDVKTSIDLEETNTILTMAIKAIKEMAQRHGAALKEDIDLKKISDGRVNEESFENDLDNLARDDEQFHEISDNLMEEIERRFDLLNEGKISYNKQGWPRIWEWKTDDRAKFLKVISRFSSNYAKYFGKLLTPLVNGIRVAGPFTPSWSQGIRPKLVLLDGEGLGHSPKSAGSVSTDVSRRIKEVDSVILVDNATQPMQAASIVAMRELVSSGYSSKLILAFTHFDEVKGDNLPTNAAKAQHVMASAENVLAAIGEDLGPYAERALRKRIENSRVFLAGIQEPLDSTKDRRTIMQLEQLMKLIDAVTIQPSLTDSRPIYDRMNLVLAVKSAAENFHNTWFPLLGLEYKSAVGKEHWTRIKALSRRLATGMADHYDTLRPVADLRRELQDKIYLFVQNPIDWDNPEPSDEVKQFIFDKLAEAIAGRMLELATKRILQEKSSEWQDAYRKQGYGSTYERATLIGKQILDPAAPVPDIMPTMDMNNFLRDIAEQIGQAADETGATLV